MTRNLKAFGLALVAAMALGAIGAQGASAVVEHSFRSEVNPTVLTAHLEGSPHEFIGKPGVEPVKCSVATFEGTQSEGTTSDLATLHPEYESCSFAGNPATVDTDGCNYVFDSDTTTSPHSSSDEHAAVNIECETPEHEIFVTTAVCNLTFTAQSGLHGVRYTQLSSHSDPSGVSKHALTVNATVKTITFKALAGSFCGLGGLPVGTYTSGEYIGKASVTGYKDTSVKSGSTTTGRVWNHSPADQVDITISTPT